MQLYTCIYNAYLVVFFCQSDEELKKFLDEKNGPVLVENYVRNLDAVSTHTVT